MSIKKKSFPIIVSQHIELRKYILKVILSILLPPIQFQYHMFFVTFPHYAFVTAVLQRKPVFQQILYIYSFVLSCNTYQVISKIHQYCRQGTEFKSYSINSFPPVVIRSVWHILASFVFVCICCLNKMSPMDFFWFPSFSCCTSVS